MDDITLSLEQKIEAILFFKGEPISIRDLAKMTSETEDSVLNAAEGLRESLSNRGIGLLQKDSEISLGTAKEASALIENIRKEEMSRDMGKAGLETLSIVLYKSPISKSEIEYIRGVNSTFILRNLMIRGLVERIKNPQNDRSFLYRPTFELFSFLGISSIEELPDYARSQEELHSFLDKNDKEV